MTDTLALVASRIRSVLRRCPDLDAATRAADVPGWDSFATVEIIFALEAELGFQMSSAEMERVDGVAALVAIVEAHAAARAPVARERAA
ncbi:MAG: acyl carrier protein [Gluconacetobacter diazotrophicus]|nr:acyl carrier protein [Gluconacetobacter diazotrophicus]